MDQPCDLNNLDNYCDFKVLQNLSHAFITSRDDLEKVVEQPLDRVLGLFAPAQVLNDSFSSCCLFASLLPLLPSLLSPCFLLIGSLACSPLPIDIQLSWDTAGSKRRWRIQAWRI